MCGQVLFLNLLLKPILFICLLFFCWKSFTECQRFGTAGRIGKCSLGTNGKLSPNTIDCFCCFKCLILAISLVPSVTHSPLSSLLAFLALRHCRLRTVPHLHPISGWCAENISACNCWNTSYGQVHISMCNITQIFSLIITTFTHITFFCVFYWTILVRGLCGHSHWYLLFWIVFMESMNTS